MPGLLLFLVLVIFPWAIYVLHTYPAWSMLYLADAAALSFQVALVVLLGTLVVAVLGYRIGYSLCRRRLDKGLAGLIALAFAGLVLLFVLAGDRIGHVSEGPDWQNGSVLLGTGLGILFAFVVPVVLGGWIFLLLLFGMEGRKVHRARRGTVGRQGPVEVPSTKAFPPPAGSSERVASGLGERPGSGGKLSSTLAGPDANLQKPGADELQEK